MRTLLSILNSQRLSQALRPMLATIAFVSISSLGGCVVNSNTSTGILEVRWEANACKIDGVATVEVNLLRGGIAEGTSGPVTCDKGFHSFSARPGTYTVSLRAFNTNGELVATADLSNIIVTNSRTTTTKVIGLSPGSGGGGGGGRTGGGSVTVGWTVLGLPSAQGCAKHGIKEVTVSILNNQRTLVNAHATVPCTTGQVTVANVPAGPGWIQLDGTTNDNLNIFGNATLHGPITVVAGVDAVIDQPLNITDLRSSVAVQWQFANNNTCAGNNVAEVFVELRDGNNKIVVPMNAADAKKPCEIDGNTEYALRVVDMAYSTPTCTIPAGAKGLVVCGITGTKVGITVSARDATTGQITFGGSMQVKEIPAGSHTNLPTLISLSACSAANQCQTP